MKMKQIAVSLITATSCFTAGAADFANFPPTEIPYGYIAPIALSQYNVSDGNGKLFRPWFSNTQFFGDIKSYNLSGLGVVDFPENWSAKDQLDALIATSSDTGWKTRKIFTNSGTSAVDYDCANTADALKQFICGDRLIEDGTSIRARSAALGDIIHSQPIYVGRPTDGHTLTGYQAFVNARINRAGRVYVGANDGMLHAFDSATGDEVFGYIPSVISAKLGELDTVPYSHQYFVDGQLSVADAFSNFNGAGDEWGTVLVGALGAGGKGLYALNVTDPTASSITNAKAKFLWEYTSVTNANLGYTYGKPVIARLSNGKWGVITGNGYKNSGDGKAHLLILPIKSGDFTAVDIALGASTSNGLSAPAVIDSNGDGMVDTVYAGDLDGNLWKVVDSNTDIASTQAWSIPTALGSNALVTVSDGSNVQPILSAPMVAKHPTKTGVMVYVGTGDYIASSGTLTSATFHSIYGVLDDGSSNTAITRSVLQDHSLTAISGEPNFRTLTTGSTVGNAKGWVINLAADEHVLQTPMIRDGRLQLMITDPVNEMNWLTQVDYLSGGLPDETVYDLNYDGALTAADNIGYVDAGTPGTPVIALNKSGDLSSAAVIARNANNDLSYTNRWWSSVSYNFTGTEEADAITAEAEAATAKTASDDAKTTSDNLTAAANPVVPSPTCGEIFFDRIRGNDSTDFDIEVEATLAGGTVVSMIKEGLPGSHTESPADYSAERGAGSGKLANGDTVTWFGFSMNVGNMDDTDETDEFNLRISYNGPYKVTALKFTTNGFTWAEYHDGIYFRSYSGSDYDAQRCDNSVTSSESYTESDDRDGSANTFSPDGTKKIHTAGGLGISTLNDSRIDFPGAPPTAQDIIDANDDYDEKLEDYNTKKALADDARALADAAAGYVPKNFDGDEWNDDVDTDDDNDGIEDWLDEDKDDDGIKDWDDTDEDNDGIKDWDDKDNKDDKDSDKDGIDDKYEDDDGDGTMNKDEDDDGDGITNGEEDEDGDGINDIDQVGTVDVDSGGVSVIEQNGNNDLLGRIRWRELLF
ncbi:MAG: PilC/PilY family type IV pilus protein [Halopseudomonas sp.]